MKQAAREALKQLKFVRLANLAPLGFLSDWNRAPAADHSLILMARSCNNQAVTESVLLHGPVLADSVEKLFFQGA